MSNPPEWIILRTSGSTTLQLARTLAEAGFVVWSPIERTQRRHRKTLKREEVEGPLMPSFVFAGSQHRSDLLNLARSPALNYRVWDTEQRRMVTKGHPHFSLFRFGGEVPTVSDRSLAHLRAAERRTAPNEPAKVFTVGERVKLTEGGFVGLSGQVEEVVGKFAMVAFPGFPVAVKISTWLLHTDSCGDDKVHVSNPLSEQALPAKAA